MPAWLMIVIVLAALLAAGAVAWMLYEKQRTSRLKRQFGPEYERTVKEAGTRRRAEAELESRARRVGMLELRELPPADRDRFAQRWRDAQAHFVDDPAPAVAEASALVKEVLGARGYPVGNFDRRAADISVDHPTVVENYREARRIALASERGHAFTEDLRRAMVLYRALFEEVLGTHAYEMQEVHR